MNKAPDGGVAGTSGESMFGGGSRAEYGCYTHGGSASTCVGTVYDLCPLLG